MSEEENNMNVFEPAEDVKVNSLKKLCKFSIPDGYINFMTVTNGFNLSDDIRIFSIDEVIENKAKSLYPENIMVIAQVQTDMQICINLNARDNLYMYVIEPFGHNKTYCMNCDFKQFLIRFTKAYGGPFWAWENRKIS